MTEQVLVVANTPELLHVYVTFPEYPLLQVNGRGDEVNETCVPSAVVFRLLGTEHLIIEQLFDNTEKTPLLHL